MPSLSGFPEGTAPPEDSVKVVDENGNTFLALPEDSFWVKIPPSENPDTKKYPALTRAVDWSDSANVAKSTNQCGDTEYDAYGSRNNVKIVAEGIVSNESRPANLSIDDVKNYLRGGQTATVGCKFGTYTIDVTDPKMVDSAEVPFVNMPGQPGRQERGTSRSYPAAEFQIQFGGGEEG